MKQLTEYTKNGYHFILVERKGDYAIFGQSRAKNASNFCAYEVIKIKHMPAAEMFGNLVEERETCPSNEEWGKLGWTYTTYESAKQLFDDLSNQVEVIPV